MGIVAGNTPDSQFSFDALNVFTDNLSALFNKGVNIVNQVTGKTQTQTATAAKPANNTTASSTQSGFSVYYPLIIGGGVMLVLAAIIKKVLK